MVAGWNSWERRADITRVSIPSGALFEVQRSGHTEVQSSGADSLRTVSLVGLSLSSVREGVRTR